MAERALVTGRIRLNWLVWFGVGALAFLLVYAWRDGGAEPVRSLSAPTTLPQVVQ